MSRRPTWSTWWRKSKPSPPHHLRTWSFRTCWTTTTGVRTDFGFLFPGLIALSPAGAVPTVPSIVACVLILVTLQALVGRERPWLPGWLRRRHISDSMIGKLAGFTRPLARGTDWVLRPRLTQLASGRAQYPIAIAVLLLATLMIPLELLPLAGFFPAAAIVLLASGPDRQGRGTDYLPRRFWAAPRFPRWWSSLVAGWFSH